MSASVKENRKNDKRRTSSIERLPDSSLMGTQSTKSPYKKVLRYDRGPRRGVRVRRWTGQEYQH